MAAGWLFSVGDEVMFEFKDAPDAPVRRVWTRVARVYTSTLAVVPIDGPGQRWRMNRDTVRAMVHRQMS